MVGVIKKMKKKTTGEVYMFELQYVSIKKKLRQKTKFQRISNLVT